MASTHAMSPTLMVLHPATASQRTVGYKPGRQSGTAGGNTDGDLSLLSPLRVKEVAGDQPQPQISQ